jgi:hypothetical protein
LVMQAFLYGIAWAPWVPYLAAFFGIFVVFVYPTVSWIASESLCLFSEEAFV